MVVLRSGRLGFVAYLFTPTILMFILPLAVYRLSLPVQLRAPYDHTVWVNGHDVLKAVGVCLVWLSVAIGIILWPSNHTAMPRH